MTMKRRRTPTERMRKTKPQKRRQRLRRYQCQLRFHSKGVHFKKAVNGAIAKVESASTAEANDAAINGTGPIVQKPVTVKKIVEPYTDLGNLLIIDRDPDETGGEDQGKKSQKQQSKTLVSIALSHRTR